MWITCLQYSTGFKIIFSGMTSWIHNWKRNGWVLSDKTEVKNKEDWKAIDSEMQGIEVKFVSGRIFQRSWYISSASQAFDLFTFICSFIYLVYLLTCWSNSSFLTFDRNMCMDTEGWRATKQRTDWQMKGP